MKEAEDSCASYVHGIMQLTVWEYTNAIIISIFFSLFWSEENAREWIDEEESKYNDKEEWMLVHDDWRNKKQKKKKMNRTRRGATSGVRAMKCAWRCVCYVLCIVSIIIIMNKRPHRSLFGSFISLCVFMLVHDIGLDWIFRTQNK